jgi:hypothetical protein
LVKQPTSIYDLGCGWNIFKRYIPNIIGIGAEDPNSEWFFADIHDYVDQDFVAGHQEAFESVFSICALHFRPISEIRQIVLEFISMVRPGGRGYLAMNLQRLLELDDAFLKEHGTDLTKIEQYVRSKLNELPVNLLCFDVYRIDIDAGFNGNIHIVFEKP